MFLWSMMLKPNLTLGTRVTCSSSISLGYLLTYIPVINIHIWVTISLSLSLGTLSSETYQSRAVDTRRDRMVKHLPFEMQGHFGSVHEPNRNGMAQESYWTCKCTCLNQEMSLFRCLSMTYSFSAQTKIICLNFQTFTK